MSQSQQAQAIELTQKAHAAELEGNFTQARALYGQVVPLLIQVIATGQKKSEERRRAKMHMKATKDRLLVLRVGVDGEVSNKPTPLPSLSTFQIEVNMNNPGDVVLLSLVEMGHWQDLPAPLYLEEGQEPQYLTPRLNPSTPDTTYHVYVERYGRFPGHIWINMHIKDAHRNTAYTVTSRKQRRYQIPQCVMGRAAEYYSTVAHIGIAPITPVTNSDTASRTVGRPLTITSGTGTTIIDAPDRQGKGWAPRRFTYGRRRFVWKNNPKIMGLEQLYEVKKEWPVEGSKTGKRMDETFGRPLCWGETKLAMSKLSTIHMAGGLDQLFREFILASIVTQMTVERYGHD